MRNIGFRLKGFKRNGFTLVELLVVMAILGVLTTLIAGGYRSAQMRGRDAQRKGDLKEIANSLELYYADYGEYPNQISGLIAACPYNPSTGAGTVCVWGTSEFTDSKTIYFKTLPADPYSGFSYVYRLPGSDTQKYQLFARLQNEKDQDCLGGDCLSPPVSISCGGELCNYAITSTNATPLE